MVFLFTLQMHLKKFLGKKLESTGRRHHSQHVSIDIQNHGLSHCHGQSLVTGGKFQLAAESRDSPCFQFRGCESEVNE
ncbi:hypothetical protein CEXT_269161 [Caerostris extrusa]|uniref:Uncharacterized protein n=1 Tax=Caerostris extrusa TaxID=172846 RepID=A0AAV4RJR7_CAEEX|nr:hypothetical protein CEXT_269161 [Caerostris extrusa]